MFTGIFITLYVQKAVSARSEVEPDVADGVGAIKEKWDANLTKLVNFRLLNFRMEYLMCTFDTKMNMSLGLIDLTQQYDGYDIELLGTPRMSPEEQLFTLNFVQVCISNIWGYTLVVWHDALATNKPLKFIFLVLKITKIDQRFWGTSEILSSGFQCIPYHLLQYRKV